MTTTFTAAAAILWTTPPTILRPGPRRAQETRDITVIAFTTAIMFITTAPLTMPGREYVPGIQITSAKALAHLPALMIIMAGTSTRDPGLHLPAWGCAILIAMTIRSTNLAAGTGAMQIQTPLILTAMSAHITLLLTARIRGAGPTCRPQPQPNHRPPEHRPGGAGRHHSNIPVRGTQPHTFHPQTTMQHPIHSHKNPPTNHDATSGTFPQESAHKPRYNISKQQNIAGEKLVNLTR